MTQNATRNERHMKPSAALWHSFLKPQTLVLLLLFSARFSFLFFPPQCMTWPAQPRLGWIVQFHTCLLCWHLSEHIFPLQYFPWHYSAFPPLGYARFISPLRGQNLETPSGLRRSCFGACHRVQFGNWSGLEEKESSPPRKHLDNCLLQHEKQLEVSGSWEQREGEAAGAAGQQFASSVGRDKEGEVRWATVQEWRGRILLLLKDHNGNKNTIQWFFQQSAIQRKK